MSQKNSAQEKSALVLTAEKMSACTGHPVKTGIVIGAKEHSAWAFPGEAAQTSSVEGCIEQLPEGCGGVKVEIFLATSSAGISRGMETVFRVHLWQGGNADEIPQKEILHADPVRAPLAASSCTPFRMQLESWYGTGPGRPLHFRLERCSGDPADTCPGEVDLLEVHVTPLEIPPAPRIVQDTPGYNSWPMIQAVGKKLVCAYCRGRGHDIGEECRGVYARTSSDGGLSWTPETLVSNQPGYGEVTIGKGLDAEGAMLLWVRCCGPVWHHDLYRSVDGISFQRIATPELDPMPMQITDIFPLPEVGLMALWFAGNYQDDKLNAWGTLTSSDNGKTWTQNVIESGLPKAEWPTEPAAVPLGNGRILVIARTESSENSTARAQFQIESRDAGKTWTRARTNIGDVSLSTPSLILDPETGLLSNYYYHRGRGILKRRVTSPEQIVGNPLGWPDPEPVALASDVFLDAGNVNVTALGSLHFAAYYSGKAPDTSIVVSAIPAPVPKN